MSGAQSSSCRVVWFRAASLPWPRGRHSRGLGAWPRRARLCCGMRPLYVLAPQSLRPGRWEGRRAGKGGARQLQDGTPGHPPTHAAHRDSRPGAPGGRGAGGQAGGCRQPCGHRACCCHHHRGRTAAPPPLPHGHPSPLSHPGLWSLDKGPGAAIAEMGRQVREGTLRGQQGLVTGMSVPSLIMACSSGHPVLLPGIARPSVEK